jgi:hypothetical protein
LRANRELAFHRFALAARQEAKPYAAAVKKSQEEQKHFTQRRKVAECAKEKRQLFFAVFAPWSVG